MSKENLSNKSMPGFFFFALVGCLVTEKRGIFFLESSIYVSDINDIEKQIQKKVMKYEFDV